MKYQTYAAQETPRIPAIRDREFDWQQLSLTDQMYVDGYFRFEWPLSAVPLCGQVFIRRHYPREEEQ